MWYDVMYVKYTLLYIYLSCHWICTMPPRHVWWSYRSSARKTDQNVLVVLPLSVSCGCRRLSQPSAFGMPLSLATKLSPKSTFSWCVVAAFLDRAELKRLKKLCLPCFACFGWILYCVLQLVLQHVFASGSFTGPQKWGGLGWGINVHSLAHRYDVTPRHVHLNLCTYSCYFEDVSPHAGGGVGWGGVGWGGVGGVGWGINVHSLAHRYDVTPRHVHLHLRTYVMLRWRGFTSRRGWGGVGY